MFRWSEIFFYILGQLLLRMWRVNTLLFVAFLAYLSFQLANVLKPLVQSFVKRVTQLIKNRQSIMNQLKEKRQAVIDVWKHRKDINWSRQGKQLGIGLWHGLKRLVFIIPAFVFLVLGNVLLRVVYWLPFVKTDRKRFNKEMKPLLYFKNYRSFVLMGLGFSLVAFVLTNYLVTVLRAAIRFLYFAVLSFRDGGAALTFDLDSLLVKNLFNAQVFVLAPILAIPIFIVGLVIAWKSAWVNFEQYRDYNNNEEGDDRFATVKEVHQQYKKVPNKTETYPGEGGVPVLHETKKTLTGATLGSQMLWQNKRFSQGLLYAERVLGLYARVSGYYYIEDGTVNMLGIGMTRSGKGEAHITTTMDINSRAEIQPSMIIGDPKGEHYQSSYKTMRRRGYDVNVLSFQNMDWSMSYNPLALAIDAAKKGYFEKTQTRVNAVAEAIYRKSKPGMGNGNEKYWEDTSISLFNAIAMALIDRANETVQNGEDDAWETITVRNIAKFLTDLGSEEVFVDELGEIVENPTRDQQVKKKTKITVYFDNLRKINQKQFSKFRDMADLNFRSSDFASEETKGNVFSSMMSGINLFLQDNIAKLTSKNSIVLESVGFPRRLSVKFRSSTNTAMRNDYAHKTAEITITGIGINAKTYVDKASALVDGEGYLTVVIAPKLPDRFLVTMAFSEDDVYQFSAEKVYQTEGDRLVLDEYTQKPVLDHITTSITKQREGGLLEKEDIDLVYSDNPKIIYLVTPPNRTEYNSLVSLFLDQLFNANYELALSNGRKCVNRILHILDEFTNIPAVPHMDTKISIGLGQNILYYLWIQNLKQLTDKYGENIAETIKENCSLKVYIKSTSGNTNKAISEDLGTRTITRRRRSSNILDEANPNVSIENPRQELLTPTQLAKLQEGEAVILRGVKGRDLSGRKITTDPIFLHEKTSLPYRYMFLQDEFDQSMTLADIPVDSSHRELELQDVAVEAQSTFTKIIDWRSRLTNRIGTNGERPRLTTRKGTQKPLQPARATSSAELVHQAVQAVFVEEDDLFYADDVS